MGFLARSRTAIFATLSPLTLLTPVLTLVVTSFVLAAGCGYGFQGSHSQILEKEGVHRIYVKPLVNNTYKPGVENVVYNALIRTLMAHRRVQVVMNEAGADAVLHGTVTAAQFSTSGSTTADRLAPLSLSDILPPGSVQISYGGAVAPLGSISVATVYNAVLSCQFRLMRNGPVPPGKNLQLWLADFSRARPFPASNQLDVPGTTSALINESEFDRALFDIATSMMDDVHESMLALF